MLAPEIISNQVSFDQLCSNYAKDLLKPFKHGVNFSESEGMELNFDIQGRKSYKINPILKLAKPENAQEIIDMVNEVYEGTYPYLEMLDVEVVKRKIAGPNYVWFLFKDKYDKTLGCFKFHVDFEAKKGYLGGFCVKKEYQGKIDSVKCQIGMLIWMVSAYGEKILVWYCENRTAHASTQYMVYICGMRPVGFYPNKDIFFGKVESDLMQVLYDEKALRDYRNPEHPKILPEIAKLFIYSDHRYDLGPVEFVTPKLALDTEKLVDYKKKLRVKVEKDEYGYESFLLTIEGSDSYFKFLHTPTVKNFEKTEYETSDLEELFVYAQEFKKLARKSKVRYIEVFVSAYQPEHQKVFYDLGLTPMGYVPSWEYDNFFGCFNDSILFSYNDGIVDSNIKLIDEAWDLMEVLNVKKGVKLNEPAL